MTRTAFTQEETDKWRHAFTQVGMRPHFKYVNQAISQFNVQLNQLGISAIQDSKDVIALCYTGKEPGQLIEARIASDSEVRTALGYTIHWWDPHPNEAVHPSNLIPGALVATSSRFLLLGRSLVKEFPYFRLTQNDCSPASQEALNTRLGMFTNKGDGLRDEFRGETNSDYLTLVFAINKRWLFGATPTGQTIWDIWDSFSNRVVAIGLDYLREERNKKFSDW